MLQVPNNTSLSTASPILIRQTQIDDNFVQNELVLSGRAKPYKPLDMKWHTRSHKEHYQGNPEASGQVLGIELPDTVWKGTWKTKYLADVITPATGNPLDKASEQIAGAITGIMTGATVPGDRTVSPEAMATWNGERLKTATEVRDKIIELIKSGIELFVQWDDLARIGIIKDFSAPHGRREDIQWEIAWEWYSDATPTKLAMEPQTDFSQMPTSMLDRLRQWKEEVTAPARFATALLDAVNEDIALVETSIFELQSSVTAYTDLVADANQSLNNMIGIATTVQVACQRIRDSLESVESEWCATTTNFSDGVDAANYQSQTIAFARDEGAQAAEMIYQLSALLQPEVLTSIPMPSGKDLRWVSSNYTGTPDNARAIADYNGFDSYDVPAGTLVIIPKIAELG